MDLTPYDPGYQIYHLRKAGMGLAKIQQHLANEGHELELTEIAAYYRNTMTKLAAAQNADERKMMIQLEVDALDDLRYAYWEAAIAGDIKAAEFVLKVINQKAKTLGLDQLTAQDQETVAQVLIVGGDQRAFLEALEHGRNMNRVVDGSVVDDEGETEVSG